MVKPILYRNIQEKNKIEAELASEITQEEKLAISFALMDIFVNARLLPIAEDSVKSEYSASKKK